jgi:hypothetical protein
MLRLFHNYIGEALDVCVSAVAIQKLPNVDICTVGGKEEGISKRAEKFGQRRGPSKREFLVRVAERLARMMDGWRRL